MESIGCNWRIMIKTGTILTSIKGSVATIWLNRPEKHNAFDIDMILDFLAALRKLNQAGEVRVIVIRGKGRSFCSGADINWLLQSSNLSEAEIYRECETLASCFFELYHSPKVTVCLVQGACIGGGNGFVAASDISVAVENSVFGFSEVRIGMLPATIAPYIEMKTGRQRAIEMMLTGRRFGADEAKSFGLVHHVVITDKEDQFVDDIISEILDGAPQVQQQIKSSLFSFGKLSPDQSVISDTASLLTRARLSEEARVGINAFVAKMKPVWGKELT